MTPRTIVQGLVLVGLALLPGPAFPSPRAGRAGPAPPPGEGPSFAVRARRIYTMQGDSGEAGVLDDATLLVIGGKVAAVGRAVKVPEGVPVRDLPDAVLIPGLVDASSSLAGSNRGDLAVGAVYHAIDAFDPYRNYAEALSEGVTTVYLSPGTNELVAGQGAVVKLAGGEVLRQRADLKVVLGEGAFRALPRQKIPFPSSEDVPIEPGTPQRPHSRLTQFAELSAKFRQAEAYAAGHEAAAAERPGFDLALDALADALHEGMPFRVEARRARDILQALRHRSLFRDSFTITGANEAARVAKEIQTGGARVILEVPVRFDAPGADRGLDPDRPREGIETAAALARAGVLFALTPQPQTRPGDLMMAAMTAVRGGLSVPQALAAVTRRAAAILGIQDRVGSLEPGKDADFLVLSGEPLRNTTSVLRTYVGGRAVFEAAGGGIGGAGAAALVVRAGTVFRGVGEPIREGAVLVEEGKITAVGHTVPVPRGARVIDAGPQGFVTPGFIDAHGHLGLENDRTDADPDLSLSGVVAYEKGNFRDVASSGVTTVLVAPYRANRGGSQVLAMKTAGRERDALVVEDPAAEYFSMRGKDPLTGVESLRAALKKGKAYDEAWKKYHAALEKWEKEHKDKTKDEAKDKKKQAEQAKPGTGGGSNGNAVEEEAKADPISGTWAATISGGPIPEPQEGTMKLKLEGTDVTGSLESPFGEEVEVSGTFQNGQLELELDLQTPLGAPRLEATLDAEDHLTGKISLGDAFTLDFEAERTEKETPEIHVRKKKKKKDGRPEPPPVQEGLEPYRKLFAGTIAALVDVQTAAQIDAVVRLLTEEFKVPLVLLNAEEAEIVGDTIVKAKAGVVLPRQILRRSARGKLEVPADRLARLGIPIAFQSGAEDGARDLPYNASYAVYYGLDGTTALRALTIDAARMFRIDDRLGSLEVGKDGDLLVFSGNPFEAASRLEHVIVSGKEVRKP